MKKILIFHPYLAPYRIDLYNRLAQFYDLKVILTGSKAEIKTLGFDLDLINQQAHFKFQYFQKGIYLGRHLLSLVYYKQILTFKPNVVIAHELGINTIFTILLKYIFNYKVFLTIDDSPSMINSFGRLRKFLQKTVIKHTDVCLTVHPIVKEIIENEYKHKSKSSFVYFPIIQDDEKLRKKLSESNKIIKKYRHEYALDEKKVILFVGRLEKVKQPDLLLQVFNNLKNANDCKLVYVGEGSLEFLLKELVNKYSMQERIIFTGKLSGIELYAWYCIADIFVLPSIHEPFGAVVNEALVAGCTVVISNQVGASSLINHENGFVFQYENKSELENILTIILKSVDLKLNKESLRPNKMNFTFKYFFDQLENYINK